MKKFVAGLLCGMLLSSVALFGASTIKSAEFNSNKVVFDGKALDLSAAPMISVIKEGETAIVNYMPVQAILGQMGYDVTWDGAAKTVIINTKAPASDSPRNSFSWVGIYEGSIPGADSEIKTVISLASDLTYTITYQYVDKDPTVYTDKGTFEWDAAGEIITLSGTDMPSQYKVGDGKLTQLDMDGKIIAGQFADNYILKQTAGGK